MSWYILFIVMSSGEVHTQEFFGESACIRALHELDRRWSKGKSFCTPKSLGLYGEAKNEAG